MLAAQEVEAARFTGEWTIELMSVLGSPRDHEYAAPPYAGLVIRIGGARTKVPLGDYVLKDSAGKLWVVAAALFEAHFRPARLAH